MNKQNNDTTDDIDLIEITKRLWINRKKIMYIEITVVLFAIIYALFATPWYSATVKILPSDNEQNGGLLGQYAGLAAIAGINMPTSSSQYDLYPEIIKSNFVLDKILTHRFTTNKSSHPITLFEFWETEIDSSKKNWKHILTEKAKRTLRDDYISAVIDDETRMLTIKVDAPDDPQLSAGLANFIVKTLEQYNKYYRNYKTTDQLKYIESSISNSEIELKKAENKMKYFLDENKDYSSPEKKMEFERIQTEYDVQKSIYLELRKQKELTQLEKIKETETLNILEYAEIPIKKYKPKRLLILLFSVVIGVIISFAYILSARLISKLFTFFKQLQQ